VAADGLHGAGDLDGGGKDLGVVGAADAVGEAGGRGVGTFEGGVAEDGEAVGVAEVAGGGGAVAADDGQDVSGDGGDLHDLRRVAGADQVPHLESRAVVDGDAGGVLGVGREGALVDGVGGGEEASRSLVHGAGGGAWRRPKREERSRTG
jgi:hypothetical protein